MITRTASLIAPLCALWTGIALAQPPPGEPRGPGPRLSFEELDGNHDGKLTSEEFSVEQARLIERRFERVDRDHSGSISSGEFEAARAALAERVQRRLGERAGREGLPGMPPFDEVDVSGDDAISLEEYRDAQKASMSRRFQHLDSDQDGAVSKQEFDAARDRFRERDQDREKGSGASP